MSEPIFGVTGALAEACCQDLETNEAGYENKAFYHLYHQLPKLHFRFTKES